MCGIFLCMCEQSNVSICKEILKNETIQHFLSRRGPDFFNKLILDHQFDENGPKIQLTLLSSLLILRGLNASFQPLVDKKTGSVLQWNGQIFSGFGNRLNEEESDTKQLLDALINVKNDQDEIPSIISSIHGPWALTFWDNCTKRLWIGRDILGRRSLCWNTNFRDQVLIVSSVSHVYDESANRKPLPIGVLNPSMLTFEEIPTDGIYCFDFGQTYQSFQDVINNVRHFTWNRNISGKLLHSSTVLDSPIKYQFNCQLPNEDVISRLKSLTTDNEIEQSIPSSVIDSFHQVLSNAVAVRCSNHQNLCRKCYARHLKFELSYGDQCDDNENGESTSEDEVRIGAKSVPKLKSTKIRECTHASTAILFSGGLDSTVLALLSDQYIPSHLPIDLLNIAFSNDAPDRETGLRAWQELQSIRPMRRWNFVSIHISKEELEECREKHIRFLVKPSETVLDDSIGCAIWFATRGKGFLMLEPGDINSFAVYTRARIVLLGMGADEQLGGYSRHRNAFNRNGWSSLINEMIIDIERISRRNLGRDDRVTSDHGIEARYPFLDESVINHLNKYQYGTSVTFS
ncbi:hypothetical protein RDWZM_010163 [Blomia tropicalis]|uniref:Glutamine amidotransferase type-2 domain-containing protein n=1 Tax=Blomia tropicalis TaxID=40697 RepID=A0A9Q0RHF6_BLOTA|nr:hypothetical protein RDWZM_010163 [Blomia tropicalis]